VGSIHALVRDNDRPGNVLDGGDRSAPDKRGGAVVGHVL